jgi:hypothetical protein
MAGRRKQVQIQVRVTALEGTPAGEVINWLRDDPLPGLTAGRITRCLLLWALWPALLQSQGAPAAAVEKAARIGRIQLRGFLDDALLMVGGSPQGSEAALPPSDASVMRVPAATPLAGGDGDDETEERLRLAASTLGGGEADEADPYEFI